ncbi:hypothetical protein Asppvi_000653 [Aspergillus pseudoviridinutans]|uniref:Uncharacterized protein n=1 Tax=Aspergillus pseudoviridinutans TaxID=1517512 RepID=A0A9P3EQZ2_9EURO|nr:uncharacterized protein Asppvi_000653 [Aspergillus pseudoviridinutans]GIJ82150.1 hypothetical protein Asppvi_000653 [Aspergillus pseudoviridinutans]
MRPTQFLALLTAVSPAVNALLGSSCISTVNSMNKIPALFMEAGERVACQAGCKPKPAEWLKYGKEFINGVVEDGAAYYCQIDDGKDVFAVYLDQIFHDVMERCEAKLNGNHVCGDPEELSEFKNCVLSNNWHSFVLAPNILLAAVCVVGEMQTGGQLYQQLTAMGP